MPVVEPTTGRQSLFYEDTCNIWKPDALTYVDDDTGEPNDTTYTLLATAQKCYYFTKTETAQPTEIGRFPADIIFTLDIIKFPYAVVIDDGYVLKLTTIAHTQLLNTFWRVIGEAQRRVGRSRRTPDFAQVYIKRLPSAPSGVS